MFQIYLEPNLPVNIYDLINDDQEEMVELPIKLTLASIDPEEKVDKKVTDDFSILKLVEDKGSSELDLEDIFNPSKEEDAEDKVGQEELAEEDEFKETTLCVLAYHNKTAPRQEKLSIVFNVDDSSQLMVLGHRGIFLTGEFVAE